MTDIKRVKTSGGEVVSLPRDPEQLHTKLIPDASDALAGTIERRGLSKTDAANRLIQIGAFFDEKLKDGYEILIRKDGQGEQVHII
jgi:hypothetical protein